MQVRSLIDGSEANGMVTLCSMARPFIRYEANISSRDDDSAYISCTEAVSTLEARQFFRCRELVSGTYAKKQAELCPLTIWCLNARQGFRCDWESGVSAKQGCWHFLLSLPPN